MKYELSNGENRVYQWDRDITITITEPESVPEVHFKWGGKAVPLAVTNQQVAIPPELMQLPHDIVFWLYTPDHTMDMATVKLQQRPKPADYVYTPTEIKTWEALDERIKALEDSGGVAGVSSVNGQTGAVTITAAGLGALTEDDLQSATDKALAQAKASGEFDGPPGAPGTNGTTPHIGDNGNWYLGETDTGKPSRGQAGAGLDVTGATVGQIVKIAAVDSDGVPTAWSAIDRVWKPYATYAIKDMTFPAAISIPQNKDVFLVFSGTDITPDRNTNLIVDISTAANETGYSQRFSITNKFYAHSWGCYIKMLLLWRENTQSYLPIVQTASAAGPYPDATKIGNPLGGDSRRNYFYITVDNAEHLNAETTGAVNIYTRDYI